MSTVWLAITLALVLLAAACSGDDNPRAERNGGGAGGTNGDSSSEASPTAKPKSEEELEEIEQKEPLKKSACAGTGEAAAGKRGRDKIDISAKDYEFDPQCPLGAGGDLVEIRVSNVGEILHNFSAPARGVDFDVPAGESKKIRLVVSRDKRIQFFCKYHADRGMRGALFAVTSS